MTIAFDAHSTGTGTGTINWTHTPVGVPRGVIAYSIRPVGVDVVTGMTYGGQTMNQMTGSPEIYLGGEPACVNAFFLGTGIPTGAQTVSVTESGSNAKVTGCYSVTAINDCLELNTDGIQGTGANPSTLFPMLSTAGFCLIVWHSGQNAPADVTPFIDWTPRHEVDNGTNIVGSYSYDFIGSADVTAGFTQTSDNYTIFIAAINESALSGSGEFVNPLPQRNRRSTGRFM